MAIAHVGSLGSVAAVTANQATAVLTTTAAASVGQLVVVLIAADNNQTTTGDGATGGQIVSLTNSGTANTWVRASEYVFSPTGAAQDGVDTSIWYSVLTSAMASGATITATARNATTADKICMTAKNFSLGSGSTVAIEGTPAVHAANISVDNFGTNYNTMNVTTANIECLRVRSSGMESNAGIDWTPTSGWTNFNTFVHGGGGAGATQIVLRGEFRISTGTSAASTPVPQTTYSGDVAQQYVAFKEVLSGPSTQALTQSARFDDADTFYTAVRGSTVGLTQSARFDDPDTFYTAVAAQPQALTQSARFDDTDTFYTGTLTPGAVALTQSARFDDADTFYTATLLYDQPLTQSARFDDPDTFYTAVLSATRALTQSARFNNANRFVFTNLLLHFDGADAATTFIDESGLTVTTVGNAQIDTAQSVFGGSSGLFDGSGDYLTVPGASFVLGTGDFVVDARVRNAVFPTWSTIVSLRTATLGFLFGFNSAAPVYHVSALNRITGSTLSTGVWRHIALVRSSGVSRLFIDGVQVGSSYTDTNNFTAPTTISIGGEPGTNYFNGWIDELRISIGTDRGWFSGFTPPASAHDLDAAVLTTTVAVTQAARFDDPDIFYTGDIATLGADQALTQSARLDDADSFPTATLSATVALTESARFDDPDSFPQGALSTTVGLTQAARFNDADSFPAAQLTASYSLSQSARFNDPDSFPQATLSTTRALVQSARFNDPDSFPAATLSTSVALTQGARFDDPDDFFTGLAGVEGGPIVLAGSLFDDPDVFFTGEIVTDQILTQAARFDDPDEFFTGLIEVHEIEIPVELPIGGSGSRGKAKPRVRIIDPNERRRIIEQDDRVVLSMVQEFLDAINRDQPWHP